MTRLLTLLPLCLLLAGCRPAGSRSARAARMGPSLGRLTAKLLDPATSEAQKQEYWRAAKGRLLRANGEIVSVGDSVLIECPPEKERKETVCVRAYPEPRFAGALTTVKPGQKLGALGELTGWSPGGARSTCAATFEVRNARLYSR